MRCPGALRVTPCHACPWGGGLRRGGAVLLCTSSPARPPEQLSRGQDHGVFFSLRESRSGRRAHGCLGTARGPPGRSPFTQGPMEQDVKSVLLLLTEGKCRGADGPARGLGLGLFLAWVALTSSYIVSGGSGQTDAGGTFGGQPVGARVCWVPTACLLPAGGPRGTRGPEGGEVPGPQSGWAPGAGCERRSEAHVS